MDRCDLLLLCCVDLDDLRYDRLISLPGKKNIVNIRMVYYTLKIISTYNTHCYLNRVYFTCEKIENCYPSCCCENVSVAAADVLTAADAADVAAVAAVVAVDCGHVQEPVPSTVAVAVQSLAVPVEE